MKFTGNPIRKNRTSSASGENLRWRRVGVGVGFCYFVICSLWSRHMLAVLASLLAALVGWRRVRVRVGVGVGSFFF